MTRCKFINSCLILAIIVTTIKTEENSSTLELVHVIFRHGDRTTDTSTIYPKDPYFNVTYFPYGRGELTKKGKQTAYKLGKILRQRYNKFLGPIYTPDIIEAITSPFNRTKTSLELVLAGLFPPTEEEIFEPGLNWQPIPFHHAPRNQDTMFLAVLNCPNFKKQLEKYSKSDKMQQEMKLYEEIFNYIAENSGRKIESYYDLMWIYMNLKTEDEWGLALPDWAKKVYPDVFKNLTIKAFGLLTGTTELRRLTAGDLLKKIVDDSRAKAEGKLVPEKRKIFLYSGHELTIAFFLNVLDIFKEHVPPYAAHIMLELHNINKTYGFKIFYQDYSSQEPELLKLPACEEFCPLEQFVSLIEEFFPEEGTCGNQNPLAKGFN